MTLAMTSLVTGLGDEVLLFLFTVVLGGVILLAWVSTNVRERPRVEAVLIQPVRPGVVIAEQVNRSEVTQADQVRGLKLHQKCYLWRNQGYVRCLSWKNV